MASRPAWKGFLRLSLVSVPVQAYTSLVPEQGEMHFHQLHKTCNSRIRYQKVCPVHGEVSRDEIVSGYEYAKGQYVVVDESEREQARTKSDLAINIDKFIPPDALAPEYFEGRTYFLVPEDPPERSPMPCFIGQWLTRIGPHWGKWPWPAVIAWCWFALGRNCSRCRC